MFAVGTVLGPTVVFGANMDASHQQASPSSVWNIQASLRDPSDLAASVAGAILPALTRANLILPVRAGGG